MSWSLNVQAEAGSFQAELESAARACKEAIGESEEEETANQINLAVAAAASVVSAGVVGARRISAHLSGHANPKHEPRAGWVNDEVRIILRQVSP
jgi:hypothetical protein